MSGIEPGGGPEQGMATGQAEVFLGVGHVLAHGDNGPDARRFGPPERFVAVVVKGRVADVGVGVDQRLVGDRRRIPS